MNDLISRQTVIDAIVTWTVEDRPDAEMPTDLVGRINALPSAQPDPDKLHLQKEQAYMQGWEDARLIDRQAAIDAALDSLPDDEYWNEQVCKAINKLPSAQSEITDEKAIKHLQSSGWMQNHDKQMYEMGLKEQLADDSGSYDALLPSAQPERKTGKWEEIAVIPYAYDICGTKTWASKMRCDRCGFITTAIEGHIAQYEYCPQCGCCMM